MPFVIGIVLALGVAALARFAGLDRDRAFYPTVLIVVASYSVLFAASSMPSMATSWRTRACPRGGSPRDEPGQRSRVWLAVLRAGFHERRRAR